MELCKAGIGVRGIAAFIDLIMVYAILYAIATVTGNAGSGGFSLYGTPFLVGVTLGLGYFILLEATLGATLGKLLTNLTVVTAAHGHPIGWRESIVRNVLRPIDGFVLYAIGFLAICVTARRQRLGDLAAGTMVVRRARSSAATGSAATLAVLAVLVGNHIAAAQSLPSAPAPQVAATAADAYRKAATLAQQKNFPDALHWYRIAADQGSVPALIALGDLYGHGQAVPQDFAAAFLWYRKAAERGNSEAEDDVGFFYLQGMGVQQDFTAAMRWLRKAADQGNEVAERNIGLMYLNGLGVPTDRTEALRWFREAAAKGDPDSKEALKMLANGT